MLKQVKQMGIGLCLASFAMLAVAATEIKDSDIPTLNPDEGRIGEIRRVVDETEFKVCADPDNMPYSNVKQEGFEDKIAEVLAKDLGKKLSFAYAYNRQGFLRNTINAMRCDVIIGTTSDFDALRTSNPYYRSGHVFVWRKDSNYNITDWDSPDLRKGIIGIVDKSPAAIPLNDHNLMGNAKPYRLQRDLNLPPSFLIDDLAKGDIDVAILWGPLAGYYVKQSKVPLEMKLIPEYNKVNIKGKEYWNISVAVRKKDKERMKMINEALARNKDKIDQILAEYGIPTVPVVDGDNVFKKD
ncbi:MAG TPA: quinoprotein dehydrogenase-associated putative ABC transporter substrate-binding protein [Methylophilaceae bacterium]|nr:quinoprotein dehydrogenase-associated putative ABC transporter substrate-binding protein [Methylophilaceae bacterium]HAJ70462.1 quinoprotein dehydrogenase-associated putative ABC transporter substrate-binding protein [Methylophilaceae bacterium]